MEVRLRQCVFVAAELEPAVAVLRGAAGLAEPYADPGVGEFGLRNAVLALGTDFLEVVSPTGPGTAAGRHLERRGDGGYMVLVQVDDIAAARARAAELGLRAVWGVDLPDISATHLHPADAGGAILSLDQPRPPESWRWGGPAWTGRAGRGAPGRLRGVTLEVPDPAATAARWARLLDLPPAGDHVLTLGDGQAIAFVPGAGGLVEVALEVPEPVRRGRETVALGAARLRLL